MRKLVECVPNFSEGRRHELIETITAEIRKVPEAFLLGKEMDADHNRAVITLAGEPEAVKEAVFFMIKKASELIDLTVHSGEHPRMGATDVVPFVPIKNMSMEECVRLAKELGQRVGDELQIPVYLYEQAAMRPDRKNLATIRKGQFEGLREEIGVNPARIPDYGPNRIHPTAGATAIGARFFLVAYNVNLDSQDLALAKRIARTVRESSGGFPCVKALGLEVKEKHCVQVSVNMTNYGLTSLATVYKAIREEAEKAGVAVLGSEVIGFLPREALIDSVAEFLQLKDFDPSQIFENRIAQIMRETAQESSEREILTNKPQPVFNKDLLKFSLPDFLETFASGNPTPGGGSASALAGALAGALVRMVCNLTVGKKSYQDVEAEVSALYKHVQQLQHRLRELIEEDSQAYDTVLAAYRLPKVTEEEGRRRQTAIQKALQTAAGTPLEVMRQALEILKMTKILAEKGNPNAITDLGCAVHLANAAIAGADMNVRINLGSVADHEFTKRVRTKIADIRTTAQKITQEVLSIIEAKM